VTCALPNLPLETIARAVAIVQTFNHFTEARTNAAPLRPVLGRILNDAMLGVSPRGYVEFIGSSKYFRYSSDLFPTFDPLNAAK
jgi:hypothetical protein